MKYNTYGNFSSPSSVTLLIKPLACYLATEMNIESSLIMSISFHDSSAEDTKSEQKKIVNWSVKN